MAKRNAVVALSSDDEEDVKSSSRSGSRSKSVFSRSDPKGPKKPRPSGPRSRSCKQSSIVDEFEFFGDDFEEMFTGVKVFAGFGKGTGKELWVDRYKPCTFEDLAVHKKKVDEVRAWFEENVQAPKGNYGTNVLLITGHAGVGKSATVKVIASQLGAMLFEWSTPTPTIWQEHMYSSNAAGAQYVSKLDEFEFFIERIRKYGSVSPSFAGRPSSPVILLIDDLPLTFGRSAYKRLQNCLHLLVQSACTPTVILITDTGHSDSADDTARGLEELISFLEKAGAYKISFNPITNNSIKRTLSRIGKQERCDVTSEQLDLIAKASGGDIRQAITSLQFLCVNKDILPPSSLSDSAPENGRLPGVTFGRDETVGLFHALGKFLHNKRECESINSLDEKALSIQDKFSRLPMKMDSPEKVLCQAHGQARPVADFLHENALDFLDEDAVDDASTVLSYLCDADMLLDTHRQNFSRSNDTEGVLQSCAASVAVRGVLFGNDHPVPPRWHSIRRPKLWQVEKAALHNKDELLLQRSYLHGSSDSSVIATEYTPAHRRIQHEQPDVRQGTVSNSGTGDGDEDTSMEDRETDASDDEDEIEDW